MFGSNNKQQYSEQINGAPPAYKVDADGTLAPKWWDVREWSWKKWVIAIGSIIAIIIIIVVVSVEEVKNNRYPDYSQLNYTLKDTYSGTDFFDNFEYFTGYDPTDGFVHYVDQDWATGQLNLTYASSDSAVLKVDTTTTDASTGRYSVRITSSNTYDDGLFIFDVMHTPYGCATWPALWLSNADNWPIDGEIDVMEAVNKATSGNQMTLHTTNDCKMDVKRKETGKVLETNCYNGTNDNDGCGVQGSTDTYGAGFNSAGGGIMAMELRSAGIRIWQFLRGSIPSDITNKNPDPSTWGEALADFPSTDCDIGSHFKNLSIIVDITLCGSWAGATSVYSKEDGCPGTCENYVADNNTAFDTAFWEFGGFWVYQADDSS